MLSEDFDSYSVGEDPLYWIDTAANNSMTENDNLFEVFELSGEKVFGTTSTATNIHSHYIGAGNEGFSNYMYSGRMMMTDIPGGIGVTFLSQYPLADVYYRLRSEPSGSSNTDFYISPHGTSVTGDINTDVYPVAGTWYSFKIEVQDTGGRTEIRAKVWEEGTTEPGWQVDAYDDNTTTRLTAGTIGMWSMATGSKYWDDLTVSTDGGPPGPGPSDSDIYEGFESGFTLGQPVGTHADWYDGGSGPVVTSGIGVAGSVGLAPASAIFTWTAKPFNWNDSEFRGVNFQADFQTDGGGQFDDDRIGWMVTDSDTGSENFFGVQLDHVDGGIVTYWREGADRIQTPIVPLTALTANAWYRFRAEITKLTATSAKIDVSLVALDSSGNPTGTPWTGTVADTSAWPDGTPNDSYFTAATMWPAYKNFSAATGAADNVCYEVVERFAFVVVSDLHTSDADHTTVASNMQQIGEWIDNPTADMPAPAFMVITGDFPNLSQTEEIVNNVIRADFLWYPVIGNHEISDDIDNFYEIRDTMVPSLPYIVNHGPAGSVNTNYSWNYGGAHFVAVNAYWDGTTGTGADSAADGDIVLALRNWIDTDLYETPGFDRPEFVFVHEPAFPASQACGRLAGCARGQPRCVCFHAERQPGRDPVLRPHPLLRARHDARVSSGRLCTRSPTDTCARLILMAQPSPMCWWMATPSLTRCTLGRMRVLRSPFTNSGRSAVRNPSTRLTLPAVLEASAVAYNRIDLTWMDNSDNETGFRIEWFNVSDWEEVETVPAGTVSYSVMGLTAETDYCYRVLAVNSAGGSVPTDQACATTPEQPPVGGVCEDFESGFTLGQTVGNHGDWYDGGSGPVVTAGNGVNGSIGLAPAGAIFTWTAHPFEWNAPDFAGVNFQMDFQTDGGGLFDDDRMGWMTTDSSTSSDYILGVQLDHTNGGIVTYWRNSSGTRIQTPIVPLTALTDTKANTWYRFRAEITKLTATSARIDVTLTELDGSGNPTGTPWTGFVADTSSWPGGAPATDYFTPTTMWPAFKNYTTAGAPADNACFEIVTTGPLATVPYVIGLSVEDAQAAIVARGLLVGVVTEEYSDDPIGDVISQDPAPDTAVAPGSFVDLVVSLGVDIDSDDDGIEDQWENLYFGNTTRDGSGDYDGDGISDRDEFNDESDPTQPPLGFSFTAYNDLAWGSGQLESFITKITSPTGGSTLPSTGLLVDYADGSPTAVTLSVSGGTFNGVSQAVQGADPAAGTDAHTVFDGKLNGLGAISYIDAVSSPLVLTVTGLNPAKAYNLVFYPNRGSYDWDRASLVTLSGADGFINESSVGMDNNDDPLFSGPSDDSTRLPANNPDGFVARFNRITPGVDGEVVLTISFDGVATSQYQGKYASALMLQEFEPAVALPSPGDVIISGIQSWNDPGDDNPGEFIELFNTTDQTISLENMQLISRVDNNADGVVDVDWQLAVDLAGKSIAPHSFFLIAESDVDVGATGVRDIVTDLDLATGEGGLNGRAISIELRIDFVHMDYVLYGRDDGSSPPAGELPPGDLAFDGSSWPRIEVIRNTQDSTSYYEGLLRRESDEDLYAGYAVEGFYTDEDLLGDGKPNGVWTSPHNAEYDGYEARNSTSPAVYPPAPAVCYVLTLEHSGQGADPVATPANSTECDPGEYVAGEAIQLSAAPDAGWQVDSWGGTDRDTSVATMNTLTMPAENYAASASYIVIPTLSLVCEDFETGYTDGVELKLYDDWFYEAVHSGPTTEDDAGIGGTWGVSDGSSIFTWIAHPFDWTDPLFQGITLQMDFKTNVDGNFDDDRVGWMISDTDDSSDNIFGVQLDPGGGGASGNNIEAYWDGVSTDNGGRTSIADLPVLAGNAWYRLRLVVTKVGATSARLDAYLYSLTPAGAIESLMASGSIEDTDDLLPNSSGNAIPNTRYFTGPIWPAYKNYTAAAAPADNACFGVITANNCQGDYNGDGDVDGADLSEWIKGNLILDIETLAFEYGRIDCLP